MLFSSPSPVAFAFVELQCLVPNFRGSALSLQQSSTVARATRKPLAAWTTVQAKTVMVVEAGSLPSRFCFYAFLNPCFPPRTLGVASLMVSLITTWKWPDSGVNYNLTHSYPRAFVSPQTVQGRSNSVYPTFWNHFTGFGGSNVTEYFLAQDNRWCNAGLFFPLCDWFSIFSFSSENRYWPPCVSSTKR